MVKIFAELKEVEDCPVRGHLKMIDDTRLVFIGQNPDKPDRICLGFRNEDGKDTKIVLSPEGYDALKHLINEPFKGKRIGFPYKPSWGLAATPEG